MTDMYAWQHGFCFLLQYSDIKKREAAVSLWYKSMYSEKSRCLYGTQPTFERPISVTGDQEERHTVFSHRTLYINFKNSFSFSDSADVRCVQSDQQHFVFRLKALLDPLLPADSSSYN